jgi:hypothetical protein
MHPESAKLLPVLRSSLLAAALLACSDAQRLPTAVDRGRVGAEYLSGAAAGALNEAGQFNLPIPVPRGPYGEITAATADRIATIFVRLYVPFQRDAVSKEHGTPVDPGSLRKCGRTFYVESAFEPLPEVVPIVFRKSYGPHWLVSFCQGATPAVSISVSAYNTDVSFIQTRDGEDLAVPRYSNFGTYELGIPLHIGAIPTTPEQAAEFVARQTGARVKEVPVLVMRAGPYFAQSSVWRIELEKPVRVRGNQVNTATDTSTVAVSFDLNFQPLTLFREHADTSLAFFPEILEFRPDGLIDGPVLSVPLVRRRGVPRLLEPATAAGKPGPGGA